MIPRLFYRSSKTAAIAAIVPLLCGTQSYAQELSNLTVRSTRLFPASVAERRLDKSAPVASAETPEKFKIVGGTPAKDSRQFPWQVALVLSRTGQSDPFEGFFCGGTLIGSRWVLTAAHCTYRENPDSRIDRPLPPVELLASAIDVVVGTHDFEGGQRISVIRIERNNYDYRTQDNDLALLELKRPVTESASVKTIKLIGASDDARVQPKAGGRVLGWGSTEPGIIPVKLRQTVKVLHYVDVKFKPTDACNSVYVKEWERLRRGARAQLKGMGKTEGEIRRIVDTEYPPTSARVNENMVCAGGTLKTQDACFGDSGGPLVVKRGDDADVQAGVVSWGPVNGCAIIDHYGVYVRLSRYIHWISSFVR